MILKRKKIHPRDLFFISSLDDLEGEIIYPSVPSNMLTRNKWEDWKTKRIVLYPSIRSALLGLSASGTSLKNKVLSVYAPAIGNSEYLKKPGITDSPISQATDEYWYLGHIRFKKIATIKVLEKTGEKIIYHYGPRSTVGYLHSWSWKEILEPWEKKGKLGETV